MSTAFQQECINRCKSISNGNIIFQAVVGESETYYVFDSRISNHHFTIYLYSDEAEFKVDEEWYIFETADYSSEDELADAFITNLEDKISRT